VRRGRDLHGGDFVLGAIRRPVAVLGGHNVGAGFGVVKGRVDDARLHARCDFGAQRDVALAAGQRNQLAVLDAAHFGIAGMNFEQVFAVPDIVVCATRLSANVVLRENSAGSQQQGELAVGAFFGWYIVRLDEQPFATNELIDMHDRRAHRRFIVAGPLHAADLVEELEADIPKGRRQLGDLIHDLRRIVVIHRITHRLREFLRNQPLILTLLRRHHRPDPIDAALGIDKGAVFLEERRAGQEYVGELCRFVQEQVLHDDAFHVAERGLDMMGVRIRLSEVLTLDIHALEFAGAGRVEHVRNAKARLGIDSDAPVLLKLRANVVAGDVAVAGEFVRE